MRPERAPALTSSAVLARVIAGVVLINLFVVVLAGLSLRQSHMQFQQEAEITTRNLAHALENELAGTVRTNDIALRVDCARNSSNRDISGNAAASASRHPHPAALDARRIGGAFSLGHYAAGLGLGGRGIYGYRSGMSKKAVTKYTAALGLDAWIRQPRIH